VQDSGKHTKLDVADARERLIRVAGTLFSKHGLDGVSTREISNEAGLNVSLISYYFGGKEGLYKTVIQEFALRMQREVQGFLDQFAEEKVEKKTFLHNLHQGFLAVTQLKIAQRHLAVLLHREMLNGLPYARETHDTVFNGLAQQMVEIFRRAQRKGILRKEIQPEILFLTLIFTLDNYVLQRHLRTGFWENCAGLGEDTEEFVSQLMKITLEGALK